jgi:hypothetical protein
MEPFARFKIFGGNTSVPLSRNLKTIHINKVMIFKSNLTPLCLFLLLLLSLNSWGQTDTLEEPKPLKIDTTILGIHYNTIAYYTPDWKCRNGRQILYLGTRVNDSIKFGRWIYFYQGGQILAKGNYNKDGFKVGKWKYTDVKRNEKTVVKWKAEQRNYGWLEFSDGATVMVDYVLYGCGYFYRNGKLRSIAKFN